MRLDNCDTCGLPFGWRDRVRITDDRAEHANH